MLSATIHTRPYLRNDITPLPLRLLKDRISHDAQAAATSRTLLRRGALILAFFVGGTGDNLLGTCGGASHGRAGAPRVEGRPQGRPSSLGTHRFPETRLDLRNRIALLRADLSAVLLVRLADALRDAQREPLVALDLVRRRLLLEQRDCL